MQLLTSRNDSVKLLRARHNSGICRGCNLEHDQLIRPYGHHIIPCLHNYPKLLYGTVRIIPIFGSDFSNKPHKYFIGETRLNKTQKIPPLSVV